MKIAFMGCRGIPARYGGFETMTEQVAVRLAAQGHEILVYCRARYVAKDAVSLPGLRRVFLPAVYTKHWETLSHTFFCVLHQCLRPGGVVLLMNNANAVFIPLLRLFGKKVFVHVDGLEWRRDKWGFFAKTWHRLSEQWAVSLAHGLVSDSHVIQAYYEKTHGRKPAYIAYGHGAGNVPDALGLKKFELESGKYLLFVGRLEPENHPLNIVEAYARIAATERPLPLALVGWAPYAQEYVQKMHAAANERVRFLGGVYSEDYRLLLHHCYAFLHASSVGGTHPVLVEAMGAGRPILTSDIPENRETVGNTAVFFSLEENHLAEKIRWLLNHPQDLKELGSQASQRAREHFDWDKVTENYEAFFLGRI